MSEDLTVGLEPFTRKSQGTGIYLLIGRHDSGKYGHYIGVSGRLPYRLIQHISCIRLVREGKSDESPEIQYIHRVLGSAGWDVFIASSLYSTKPVHQFIGTLLSLGV